MARKNEFYPRAPKNNDTDKIFQIHYRRLLAIAANVFVWRGLPPSIPAWEIEKRLFRWGWAVVFNHQKYGIVTSDGSIFGTNIYNHAERFIYSQPKLGDGRGALGVSGVCIYNSSPDMDVNDGAGGSVMGDLLLWYARALTDVDVSQTVGIMKTRQIDGVVANTQPAANALDEYYGRLERGELKVPFAPATIFENITDLVQRQSNSAGATLSALSDIKQQIMRNFYADFGVQTVAHKGERMIVDEIDSDTDFLSANVHDMLMQRKNAATKINEIFGTKIRVEVNNYVTI